MGLLDYVLAKQLLAQRGQPVTAGHEEDFQQQRLTTLAKQEKSNANGIVWSVLAGHAPAVPLVAGFLAQRPLHLIPGKRIGSAAAQSLSTLAR